MLKKASTKKNLFTNNDFEDIRSLVNKSLGLDVSTEFNESRESDEDSSEILNSFNTVGQSELDTFTICSSPVRHTDKNVEGNLMRLSCIENVETSGKISGSRKKGINELCRFLNGTYFEHITDYKRRSEGKGEEHLESFAKEDFMFSTEVSKCVTVSQADSNNNSESKKNNYEVLCEIVTENLATESISDKSFVSLIENADEMSLSNSCFEEQVLNLENKLSPKIQNKENKRRVCSHCLKQFQYPSQLERHIRTHTTTHKNFSQKGKRNKYFASKSLTVENVDCDSEKQKAPKIELPKEASMRQCPDCLRTFKVPSKLLRHIKSHVGLKPYVCHSCSKAFLEKFNFEAHIKNHCKEQSHICDVCKRAFSIKSNLRRHLRSVHRNGKSFICSECGSTYSSEKKFEFHVRHHQERTHKCIDCGKEFKKKSNLKRHLDIHTDTRRYPCNSCDYIARQRDHLKTHIARQHKMYNNKAPQTDVE